jgi:lipopolysaccharide/colanic/teichoic acid biosynthesis glycosyltransferase
MTMEFEYPQRKQTHVNRVPEGYLKRQLAIPRLKRLESIQSQALLEALKTTSTTNTKSNVADFQYYNALNRSKQFSLQVTFHLSHTLTQVQQAIKSCVERAIALAALLLLSPVLALVALAIYLDNPGPILYKSTRIGRHQQPFGMFKFRTMVVNADAQRDALRDQAGLHGQLFKLKDDPRITRIGGLLRRFSIDEIPQLLNVVQGNMSLIGPRPLPADESQLFMGPFTHRFDVLPGLTGIWQVKGRSNCTFSQLCLLELNYLMHWNLLADLEIIALTFPAVLKSKGAY